MKVLMVSHTSLLQGAYQELCVELAKYEDIELKVLVPEYWKELWSKRRVKLEKAYDPHYEIIVSSLFFEGNGHLSCFRNQVSQTIKRFKPDILDVEREPWSLGLFQMEALTRLFNGSSTKIIFRSSQNLMKVYPPPFCFIEKATFRLADRAVLRSQEAYNVLAKRGFKKPMYILPHGVDTNKFSSGETDIRQRLNLSKDDFLVGYVGALTKQKGLSNLLEAISTLPQNVKGIIIGDGPIKEELQTLTEELGITDRIFLTGTIPHNQLTGYMRGFDVFVLPSITLPGLKEKFGRVLIEAMACQIPVIGSSSGAIPDVIGDSGLVFPEGDSSSLAHNINRLLTNPELAQTLAKAGRELAVAEYSWKSLAAKTRAIYKEALGESE